MIEINDKTDPNILQARYNLLRENAVANGTNVETSVLREMVQILDVLRRRTGGPPRIARPKAIPTIEDL